MPAAPAGPRERVSIDRPREWDAARSNGTGPLGRAIKPLAGKKGDGQWAYSRAALYEQTAAGFAASRVRRSWEIEFFPDQWVVVLE